MIDPSGIKFLDIECTSYCNLHCPQCDRFDRQGFLNRYMPLAHLDLDRILHNLELDRLPNLQEIKFEGDHGDAAMHPNLLDSLAALHHVPKIHIATNGSLRNTHWWQQLASFKNVSVTFAIDGLADTNHTYRINSEWQKIIANASAYIKAGGAATWKFIVFRHNEHQVEPARALSEFLGFQDFITHVSDRNFFGSDAFAVMFEGESKGYDLNIASTTAARPDSKTIMMQKIHDDAFESPACSWLDSGSMYVDYQGNLIPCCMTSGLMWRRDISAQLWQKIVGDLDSINLYHHPLSAILDSEFYQTRLQQSFDSMRTAHHVCVAHCS